MTKNFTDINNVYAAVPKIAAKVAKKSSFPDLCYSAAAFAPKINPIVNRVTGGESTTKESFAKRLDDFMDELGI